MRRRTGLYALFAAVCLMVTGCLGAPRTETIILNDAEQQPTGEEASPFTVQTIYSVLDGQAESGYPLGWIDAKALLMFTPEYPSRSHFDRVNEPYTAAQKLSELDFFRQGLPMDNMVLSPDRRHAAYIGLTGDSLQLYLYSLDDGENIHIETTKYKQILSTRMSWSKSGRFLCYATEAEAENIVQINIYDTIEGKARRYSVPFARQNESISSIYISDNGEDTVIVKRWSQGSVLEYGEWRDNEFVIQYRHPISDNGWVEWIHPDQIAFTGADGTLYAYDRRNDALSVLLNDVGRFRLSDDRKLIAYTQGGDSVYAARLYGNNVLDMKQIYKGIEAYQMVWSPDNRKLLIVGNQLLKQLASQEDKLLKNQGMVIEFQ